MSNPYCKHLIEFIRIVESSGLQTVPENRLHLDSIILLLDLSQMTTSLNPRTAKQSLGNGNLMVISMMAMDLQVQAMLVEGAGTRKESGCVNKRKRST